MRTTRATSVAITTVGLLGGVLGANAWLAAGRRRGGPRMRLVAAPKSPERPPPWRSTATRDELYELAKRLEIAGRSRMSKAQLERVIAERTPEPALG